MPSIDSTIEQIAATAGPAPIEVSNPYTGKVIGAVPRMSAARVREALEAAHAFKPSLSRHQRAEILERAAAIVRDRAATLATLITAESGLCL